MKNNIYSTSILRWKNEFRNLLFNSIHYTLSFNKGSIWRTSSDIELGITNKFCKHTEISFYLCNNHDFGTPIYYRTAGIRYWIIFLNKGFGTESLSNKVVYSNSSDKAKFYNGNSKF